MYEIHNFVKVTTGKITLKLNVSENDLEPEKSNESVESLILRKQLGSFNFRTTVNKLLHLS